MNGGRRKVRKLAEFLGYLTGPKRTEPDSAPKSPEDYPPGEVRIDEESQSVAIEKAEDLWRQGHKASAFNLLRQTRLHLGPSAALQYEYGRKAFEQGNIWAAREALHDAVELDPTHLDALELFLKINRMQPAASGSTTAAFTALAKLLPYAPGFDSEAAAFLLPSMSALAIVDQKIRMLRYSEDPVAKHIGLVSLQSNETWHTTVADDSPDLFEAKLIVALARSEYDVAFGLLDRAPVESKPKRAMRLAIQKELRLKHDQDAHGLLKHYRTVDPDDQWSRQALKRVSKSAKYLSHSQLATKGFPFPQKAATPTYEADPQKVFYLLHSSLPHHSVGYATRTQGLLRGIRGHGWNVQGVTRLGYPYDMPNMESLGPVDPTVIVDDVPYHRLSTTEGMEKKNPLQGYISRYSKALEKLALKNKPFVMHAASNHWNGLAAVTTARRLGIPSIYEVRGLWEVTRGSRNPEWMGSGMYRYMARMEADAAANADRVITITNALKEELIARGIDEAKISLVPNGVEQSRFKPRDRNDDLATRLGLQGKTVVGYVGSILDYEGIGLLIDAAQSLKQERNDVAFLLIGDGAELAQFRERVERENLSDIVLFTGRVPHHEVENYYSIIDICPFPRLPLPVCEMVSPLKPFEAMAMKKAVIASNVAALSEIVNNGSNGLLFEKGSAESLTEGLRLLVDKPELRKRLADRGRSWVEHERDWSTLSRSIGDIYSSLGGCAQPR